MLKDLQRLQQEFFDGLADVTYEVIEHVPTSPKEIPELFLGLQQMVIVTCEDTAQSFLDFFTPPLGAEMRGDFPNISTITETQICDDDGEHIHAPII